MSRADDYKKHIAGAQWRDIASASKEATDGLCAFCGHPVQAVHHVAYPKRFEDDCPQNTVPVCKRCHRLSHGGRDVKQLTVVSKQREPTPVGGQFAYVIADGVPWGSAESWCSGLRYPSIGHFKTLLFSAAVHVRNLGTDPEAIYEGVIVYRWSTIAQALRSTDAAFKKHGFKKPQEGTTQEQWEDWMGKYDALFLWGTNLQERALAAAAQAVRATSSATTVNQAVAQALTALQDGFSQHDTRLDQIERIVHRDPAEFLTCRAVLRENSFDESVMPFPNDRRNWSTLLGMELKESGAAEGPLLPMRLDGSAVVTLVHTWHRSDAHAAIDRIQTQLNQQSRLNLG